MADGTRAMIEMRTPAAQAPARQTVIAPAAPVAKAYPPKIAKAILTIARKIQPVEKAGINDFHKYAYPKWEDIRDSLWPMVNEQGLLIIQNEKSHEGLTTDMIAITYDFTILSEDGDVWPDKPEVTAICKIRDNKGVLDDKAASKCRTQAEKNAMVQIFKIRTEDVYEVDQQGKVHANSPRRTAPSPDGAFQPQNIPIKQDETASQWAERFKGMLKHAKTPEDVDAWYAANERVFARLGSEEGYKAVYQGLVDAMDARATELAPPEQQPVPAVEHKQANGGFPGDKPMKAAAIDAGDIPPALRRTAPPPPAEPAMSPEDRQWLDDLATDYTTCTTVDEIVSVQESNMMPWKDHVSQATWQEAVELTKAHAERASGG